MILPPGYVADIPAVTAFDYKALDYIFMCLGWLHTSTGDGWAKRLNFALESIASGSCLQACYDGQSSLILRVTDV